MRAEKKSLGKASERKKVVKMGILMGANEERAHALYQQTDRAGAG